jgi:hypothetical protein
VAVTVAAATTTTVAIGAVHVSRGRVSLTAGFSPAAVAGSTLELLALDTKAGSSNRFKVLATVSLPVGDSAVTLRGALARHARWLLVAEYVPSTGAPATIGALRGVNVG